MNVVDTSGWIEFLFEGRNADVFAPLIEDVDNLLVPVICLYEVFKKVNVVADEPKALQAIGLAVPVHALAATVGARRPGSKPAFDNSRCSRPGLQCSHFGGNRLELARRQLPQRGNDPVQVGLSHSWLLDGSVHLRLSIQYPTLRAHQMSHSTAFANRAINYGLVPKHYGPANGRMTPSGNRFF